MNNKILSNIEIHLKIISELKKSEKEILVVSNWFLDKNLFEILLQKQKQGVKVKLMIEGNGEYKKIKLMYLKFAGAEIYKFEKVNFGLMHKRYCIIDEKIAIFPLVNWSPYFPLQNHESLIVTSHSKTLHNFNTHFFEIKGKATKISKCKIESSIFTRIKNTLLNLFKIKPKVVKNQLEIDSGTEIKTKKEIIFKMVSPSDLIDDESSSFFFHRN